MQWASLACLNTRMTSRLVGGINNRLRIIDHRADGFYSYGPLISMLYLCCGGIELTSPHSHVYEESQNADNKFRWKRTD